MDEILGKKVKDRTSGFVGTVVGKAEYAWGEKTCMVQPEVAPDGAYRNFKWINFEMLDIIG